MYLTNTQLIILILALFAMALVLLWYGPYCYHRGLARANPTPGLLSRFLDPTPKPPVEPAPSPPDRECPSCKKKGNWKLAPDKSKWFCAHTPGCGGWIVGPEPRIGA